MPLNINWQQILLHLLNLVILIVGLYLLLYKPVKKFMKKREDAYKEREENTQAALDNAKAKEEEYSSRLAGVESCGRWLRRRTKCWTPPANARARSMTG